MSLAASHPELRPRSVSPSLPSWQLRGRFPIWEDRPVMTDADRQVWLAAAPVLQVQLQGHNVPLFLTPKVFASGSVGWYSSSKASIGDSPCQVNLCITCIGTKREPNSENHQENGKLVRKSQKAPEGPGTPQGPKGKEKSR